MDSLKLEYGPHADQIIAAIRKVSDGRNLGFSEEQIERIGRMMAAVETDDFAVDVRTAAPAIETVLLFLVEHGVGPYQLKKTQDFLLSKLRSNSDGPQQ